MINVSGHASWVFEMEIVDYQPVQAPAADGPGVGTKGSALRSSSYTGTIEEGYFGDGSDRHDYLFPGLGWFATSDKENHGTVVTSSTCGFVIDYCTGIFATGAYQMVDYELKANFNILPGEAVPVLWLLEEFVVFANVNDPGDAHLFWATGEGKAAPQIYAASTVPVPGSLALLGSGGALLAGLRRRRGPPSS